MLGMAIRATTTQSPQQAVFTVSEVAASLRLSDETVRRKIQTGELGAMQIGTGSRKALRILARDLVQWLGPESAHSVFGIGQGLDVLEEALVGLEPAAQEQLIERAKAFAKERTPERELTGRTVSPEEIAKRFPKQQ